MKKLILTFALALISVSVFAQVFQVSFNQRGVINSGQGDLDGSFILSSPGFPNCSFDADFSYTRDGNLSMYVYNPSIRGFVPATYVLFSNGTLNVYANNEVYHGTWKTIRGEISFKGNAGNQGHCTQCGLRNGHYICAFFDAKVGDPTTCTCGHRKSQHAYRN